MLFLSYQKKEVQHLPPLTRRFNVKACWDVSMNGKPQPRRHLVGKTICLVCLWIELHEVNRINNFFIVLREPFNFNLLYKDCYTIYSVHNSPFCLHNLSYMIVNIKSKVLFLLQWNKLLYNLISWLAVILNVMITLI